MALEEFHLLQKLQQLETTNDMTYEIKKYPDGGCYAKVVPGDANRFTYRINTYEDLFMLRSIKDAWDHQTDHKPLEVVIPCMFQQQHDRRFDDNQSFELKLVCEFINGCKFQAVHVFHPHNESAVAMGLNNVKFINTRQYYSDVYYTIVDHHPHFNINRAENKPLVMSTDAGSFKWVNKIAEQWNIDLYSAGKVREPGTGNLVQAIDCQDFQGRNIIVVDDLCVFGGTFVGLAKMLKQRNCGRLALVVSHVTVKNPNKDLESLYDVVYTTNSKFEQQDYDLANLKVIKRF
jgi:ribose-phosphate pyrophosphokinase